MFKFCCLYLLAAAFFSTCTVSMASVTTMPSASQVFTFAAHCFWNDGEGQHPACKYAVALGKIYRPWNTAMDYGAHFSNVSQIKIPSHYIGAEGHNQDDIALVTMATPVVYTFYIRPVCLDFSVDFDRKQLQNRNLGRVSGWGLISVDGSPSQVLLTTELQYVDVETCMAEVPVEFRSYITSDKICARGNGTTVCKGDSGGGLVFPNEERGARRYYLRGVVSTAPTGEHRCNGNSYTSFTHILPHATFIKDHGFGDNSVHDGQVHVGGCILPDYPSHGTYSVHNKPGAAPGQAYDTVILTVTCELGYGVIGNNFTYCFGRNYWLETIPQCSRFCNATPDESVNYRCKVSDQLGDTRTCNEFEPNGTIVVPRCNGPKYVHSGVPADMHCIDGSWDYVAVCETASWIMSVASYQEELQKQASNTDGCVLPEYPAHGSYTVVNKPQAVPGQSYDMVILTVTCDPGYGVAGENFATCFKKVWTQPVPQCTRFCELPTHLSVRYTCEMVDDNLRIVTRLCNESEPSGTIAVPRCNSQYHHLGVLEDMHCINGSWDHIAICQPKSTLH